MKLQIQAPITLESKLLIQNITRQIKAFTKNHKTISEVDIRLKHDITAGHKVSEVYLKMDDKNIFAIQSGRTFELATGKTIIKLQRQVSSAFPSAPDAEQANDPTELIE
jgi:hypothetical protein